MGGKGSKEKQTKEQQATKTGTGALSVEYNRLKLLLIGDSGMVLCAFCCSISSLVRFPICRHV